MQTAVKERVLLIDDEPEILVALEDLLEEDFVVLKTAVPEEALEIAQRDRGLAVVISDQRMPKMTGDELLTRLGSSSEARRILVTAFADLSAVIRAVNNGKIFAYVTKPWNPDDLRMKVHQAADHYRLAQQLARERRLLDSILSSLNEGIVAADPNGRCLLFNPQAERILGLGPKDVDPENWARHYGVFTDDRSELLPAGVNPLLRAMAGEHPAAREVFVRNVARAGAIVNMTATPLGGGAGGVTGGVAVLRDVTRQRQLETQLNQSQKMDAIGRLAGGVAHDFNNLLVVIQSYAELVRDGLAESDPARGDLTEVLGAARRAAALTKQLLAFSRSETARPAAVQLNDLVSGIEKMLRRIIGEDIELSTRLGPELWLIRADPGQLDQVILNLCVNARDAMLEGGEVVIETSNLSAGSESNSRVDACELPRGDYVLLSIRDTGTGMDAETQRHIFEPFFTTKDVGKGTGLGLSTVYGIVQQSGGQIRVVSAKGRGSTFKIYFPRMQGAPSEPAPAGDPVLGQAMTSRTVLIVEDYAEVRQVTSRILRQRGYAVLEAHSPSEARAVCAAPGSKIDLLLTDVIMPECSGPKLASELCAAYPTLRVLYMSGYPGTVANRAGVFDGALDAPYIEKPFSPDALAQKVEAVLTSTRVNLKRARASE